MDANVTSNNCSAILVTIVILDNTYYLSVWFMDGNVTSNNCSAILVTVAILDNTYYLLVWLMDAYYHF